MSGIDWQVILEVDGSEYPVAVGWSHPKDGFINVTVNGGIWFKNVDVRLVDEVNAYEVKKGVVQIYQLGKVAHMPEPLRGLQSVLETEIDAWFASQPQ